jgi:hypothetical protein
VSLARGAARAYILTAAVGALLCVLPALGTGAGTPWATVGLLTGLYLACELPRRCPFFGNSVPLSAGSFFPLLLAAAFLLPPAAGEQPLSATIVRAVNAYDDLSGEGLIGPRGALERLRLGTGHDYQPEVVESLARVLARGGLAPVLPGLRSHPRLALRRRCQSRVRP